MNSLLNYMYRDAANWKVHRSEILEGELSKAQYEELNSRADDFIPAQIGLDDLQGELGAIDEDSHIWHEILEIEPSDQEPTKDVTAQAFYEAVKKGEWDEVAAMREHGILQDELAELAAKLNSTDRAGWRPILEEFLKEVSR